MLNKVNDIPPQILLIPHPDGILVTVPSEGFQHKKIMDAKQMTNLAIDLLKYANQQHNE